MKKIIYFFLVIVFSSNAAFADNYDYDAEIEKIVSSYLRYIRNEKGVVVAGRGGGAQGEVSRVSLSLDCYQSHKLESARLFFVGIVEELLRRINSHKIIRPYLKRYPFSANELHFLLGYQTKNGKFVPEEFIGVITLSEGKLYYNTYNHSKDQFNKPFYSEPYSVARDIYYKYLLSKENVIP